ncbi:hypothetical protein EJ08DRAFT_732822 [Tothia fuscella]|uniref:CENP-Q, a CENPA-CAD centromere complex subunit-domain-containing protein n=1 Tax=Tothia fuscella TaxID=1048955 RepID=A0A9P4NUR1_9PEZI|nr:hypothetical protein EJ08DRAFT_732822 [Tothia fuscella]
MSKKAAAKPSQKEPPEPQPTNPKKRKSTHQEPTTTEDAPPQPKRPRTRKFPHLKPQTRRIPQETISTQWKRLAEPSQRQVRELFLRAKRTSLNGIRDPRRRTEAESAVSAMVRKLERQLPRMPFPPRVKEGSFCLDGIVGGNRALEAEETVVGHSIDLLKGEIEREERRLERRREILAELEAEEVEEEDAGSQRQASHPLLEKYKASKLHDDADAIGLIERPVRDSFFDSPDPELQPLITQLGSHLDNIQANTAQLDGLSNALTSAEAALNVGRRAGKLKSSRQDDVSNLPAERPI